MIRLYACAAVLVALLGLGWYLHHRGYVEGVAAVQAADAKALQAQLVANAQLEASWRSKLEQKERDYAAELASNAATAAARPIGPVRLCRPSNSRPLPTTAGSAETGPAGSGGLLQGNAVPAVAGPDIGAGLDMLARSADAVVAACRLAL